MGEKKHRKISLPMIMIGFNILISMGAAFTFWYYVYGNQQIVHDIALQNVMEISEDMSRHLKDEMRSQHNVLETAADYITGAGLSEEQALVYLEHISNIHGSWLLADPNDYQGIEIMEKEDVHSGGTRQKTSIAEIDVLKKACVKSQSEEKERFTITDIFKRTDEAENEMAFYQSITIEGQKKVLFYIIDIEKTIVHIIDGHDLLSVPGILIDSEGRILFNNIEDGEKYGDNFFEYQEKYYGKKDVDDMKAIFAENKYGNFIQKDDCDSKNKWLYTYGCIGDDETSDWIYLNKLDNEELENKPATIWPIIAMSLFMTFPWLINVSAICWQNGRLRRRQHDIEEKNKQLENANQAQMNFISNMSHEIRTPINAVLGMDEMIIRETGEEEIREYAYNIKSAGRTLLGIINDILDFTKIESGKMDIIPQEYELSSVVNDLLNMIEARAKGKGLELHLNLNPRLPSTLFGDELRIKQVILNLLTNAVKYTQEGSVTLNLDYERLDEENIMLLVSVKDTGIGIRPEELEKISRPFERLDEKRNRTIEGTGLGMSIVTSLLYCMESRLEIESTYGAGSSFFFRLKQKVVSWNEIGNLEEKYKEVKEEVSKDAAAFHASRAKLLVVDDTVVNLTVVKGLLKRTGVQVDTAESGAQCLSMCEKKQYDVILLDHRMPEIDGVETLHRLKESKGKNSAAPVIALTANAVSGAYEYYLKEGFSDFLSKPVSANKLERMILKYLPEDLLDTPQELMAQLDEKEGSRACGSVETYEQVCREYAATAEKNIRELLSLYEKGDIENYTIKVHALKSSSRLVGALSLSEKAEFLERCGKEGRLEEIEEQTAELIEGYRSVAKKLAAVYNMKQVKEKPLMEENMLKEALEAMLEFSQAFDFDEVDRILKQLEDYQLPPAMEARIDELKTAVYDVSQPEIEKIIGECLGGENE